VVAGIKVCDAFTKYLEKERTQNNSCSFHFADEHISSFPKNKEEKEENQRSQEGTEEIRRKEGRGRKAEGIRTNIPTQVSVFS